MRRYLIILVASLLSLAQAQQYVWTNYTTADGLGSNRGISVYVDNGVIYVATNGGGLSVSADGGANWTTYTETGTLASNFMFDVYAENSIIYAATLDGLSVSTDNGATWTTYNQASGLGSDGMNGVYADGSTVYAATRGGLSVSIDGGINWITYSLGDVFGVYDVYAEGNTIYAATNIGLSVSTDGGTTWTTYTSADGLGDNRVSSVYADSSTIYAATDDGLSVSTDGGATWTTYTSADGLGDNRVSSVYADSSTIYAATDNGLSVSTDGGAIWTTYTSADGLRGSTVYGGDIIDGVHAEGSTIYAVSFEGLSIGIPTTPQTIINPDPDIQVRNGNSTSAASITSGSAVSVGLFKRGEVATVDFLVRNPGAQVLKLGELSLPSFLSNAGDPLPATLASFGSALLTLAVDTSSAGALTGEFSLTSNDPDSFENPFVFTVTGSVSEAPANVLNILPGVDLSDISAATGEDGVVLLSFKLLVPAGSTSVTVDSLTLAASNAGIERASNLKLYIDGGTRGELDNRDVFVASTDDTAALTFSLPARTFSPDVPMWFIVVGDF